MLHRDGNTPDVAPDGEVLSCKLLVISRKSVLHFVGTLFSTLMLHFQHTRVTADDSQQNIILKILCNPHIEHLIIVKFSVLPL